MSEISSLALPHVAAMHAYTPGLQPTEPGWVKLNTNECPYPPSPRAAAAIIAELSGQGEKLRLYPNPKATPLRQLVAKLHGHGLTEANALIGNGSDDVLNLLVRVFGGPASPISVTIPSYSLYPVLITIQDGRCAPVEFDRSMKLPIEKLAATPAKAGAMISFSRARMVASAWSTGASFSRDHSSITASANWRQARRMPSTCEGSGRWV